MDDEEQENPELERVIEDATAEGEPGARAARREAEQLEDEEVSPRDGLQM